ncbi:MAG: Sec-independent protein translocase protein TatB [Gammaproteobacteria bacterium]|nr:Sec-independent protein translocase protein TatB [Gammaproteobacteria bacterium]
MFDIGFWELVVIGVVALFVVGPERFPGMVRKAGYWMGQFRRMASAVKSEFDREVDKAEELQRLLEEQKRIVENNSNIDLTQPAVKPKSMQQEQSPAEDKQPDDTAKTK